jgi:hypothetical protein
MSFWRHLNNIWVLMYSVNISLLLAGVTSNFIPFVRPNLISTQGSITFFGVVLFIFVNVITFGVFRRFMYSDIIRPWFLE